MVEVDQPAKQTSLRDFRRILLGEAAAQELAAREGSPPPHPAKRERAGRVTLASAKKQADRAGLFLAAAEVYADHMRLEFGALDPAPVEIDTPEKLRRLI